jgi:hypothetical protein
MLIKLISNFKAVLQNYRLFDNHGGIMGHGNRMAFSVFAIAISLFFALIASFPIDVSGQPYPFSALVLGDGCGVPEDCAPRCTQKSHKLYTIVDCINEQCSYSGYQCVVGECGALCDADEDCPCPADGCVGSDYYDYPDNGYCGTAGSEGCLCQVDEQAAGQCEPVAINACDIANCGAECQDMGDCSASLMNEICYFPSSCQSCSCVYDNETCPVPGTVMNSTCYYGAQSCNSSGCGLDECVLANPGLDVCDPQMGCLECVYVGTIIDDFTDAFGVGAPSMMLDFLSENSTNLNARIEFNFTGFNVLSAKLDGTGLPLDTTYKGRVDAALVEDISGSMDDDCGPDGVAQPGETPCKINDKKDADINFINTMLAGNGDNSNKVALVAYSDYVIDSLGLTDNMTRLAEHIDSYTPFNSTCISCGIEEGISLLSAGSNPMRIMVLMSDGRANECLGGACTMSEARQEAVSKAAEAWNSHNITVYSVAYGSDADINAMMEIASAGNGMYFFTDNLNISDVFGYLAMQTFLSYPHNPAMDLGSDGAAEWSYMGDFATTESVDFTHELASLAAGCGCAGCNLQNDTCGIELAFFSEKRGRILIDALNVTACSYLPIVQSCIDADNDTYYAHDAVFCVQGDDCNDGNAGIHPGASETCNSRDDDCDGQADEGLVCGQGNGGDGGNGGNGGSGRRGGGTVVVCTPDWECSDYEDCQPDGTRERDCWDNNDCGDDDGRPSEIKNCSYVPPEPESVCAAGARMCADGDVLECMNGTGWDLAVICKYGCNSSSNECNPMSLSFGTTDDGFVSTTSDGLTGMLAASRDSLYGLLALLLIVLVAIVVWKKRGKGRDRGKK